MSRHRMVRNLTEDDYYDDDYDDYYDEEDDDYEGYDNSHVAAPKQKKNTNTSTVKQTTTAKKQQQQQQQQQQPATTISAKIAMAAPDKKAIIVAPAASAMGVVKPPPGWGKPSSASAATATTTTTSAISAGVNKPPPGWGKPVAVSSSSSTTTTTTPVTSGISKPPPGWDKPPSSTSTSTETPTTSTSTSTNSPTSPKRPAATASNTSQQQQQQQQHPYKPKPLPPCLQHKNKLPSQLSMVVIGHVDAGKSTLTGQLLIQTGQISKRQVRGAGSNLAWLLDETTTERERGVTMEIGTKSLATKKNHQIILLDAPGHKDFIPIMITGAAHADTALLVVDGVTGEFEAGFIRGGQTKEHVLLAKGLGVSQVIVAVNKLDVEGWKQDRYESVTQQVVDYLVQQRFQPGRIQCVPVSGLTGENVASQSEPLLREWYSGPTLLQAMDRFKPANRHLDKPLRFIVSDMYAEGKGVVTRGRVVQGFLQVGDKVTVLPLGDPAVISKLEHMQHQQNTDDSNNNHHQDDMSRLSVAMAGDTVEIVLANVDPMRIAVGNVIVDPSPHHLPPIAKGARAKVLIMDDLTVPIIRGAQVLFHMHSLDVPASLNKLIALLKPDGSGILKERPRALTSGVSAMVELKLSDNTKIVMDRFQECRALGRFVLRRGGDTIAVGVIEEIIY